MLGPLGPKVLARGVVIQPLIGILIHNGHLNPY